MQNNFFGTCPRGLETVLASELQALGASETTAAKGGGGVHFCGDWGVAMAANLHSRIASRILFQVSEGAYRNEDDVYRQALETPWSRWFTPDQTLRVDVTASKSPLKSLNFITLRIKDGVCDRMRREHGRRPSVEARTPDVRIAAFLSADRCALYLDTSGTPLWQRGLRQKTVVAPLKENLAAGLLHLSGWRPGMALLDPMCGSGTLLMEAAQMALGIAPGKRRGFGFERLLNFDAALWEKLRQAAREQEVEQGGSAEILIHGSDHTPEAVRAARANLDRAGLLEAVCLEEGDILEIVPPTPQGVLLCNPPYGTRIEEEETLAAFYPRLGDALKRNFAGWEAYFFSADLRMPKLVGLKAHCRTPLFNGALECRLFGFRMVAGSNR
ncbi:MAG: THUMP domain-containing protein [Betaproteobacteria bacterium]|nr:THUMP domain-containing protein [Betaproteobacteria bacterium]